MRKTMGDGYQWVEAHGTKPGEGLTEGGLR